MRLSIPIPNTRPRPKVGGTHPSPGLHSWSSDEWRSATETYAPKFEVHQGRLFWCVEHRLAVLGLMLENLGVDAAVRLGDPKVWREAIDALERSDEAEGQLP